MYCPTLYLPRVAVVSPILSKTARTLRRVYKGRLAYIVDNQGAIYPIAKQSNADSSARVRSPLIKFLT